MWQRVGGVVYRLTPVSIICAPESLSMYGHVDTWTVMVRVKVGEYLVLVLGLGLW